VVEFTPLAGEEELLADLERRDFSVNALAMAMEGEIIDPTGGRNDLEHRLLRPCSSRCFEDDPLRIFRGLRFETDGWRLTAEAEALISGRGWEGELAALPGERFGNELRRALAGEEPARFFHRMVELGVGRSLLPELFHMAAVPAGPREHHPEGDLLCHSLQTLERLAPLSADPLARFCALFHDLGKLATPPVEHPRHIGHEKAGCDMAAAFCRRLRLPSSWGRALSAACRLHLTAGRWPDLRPVTRLSLAERALRGGIGEFLPLLTAADRGNGLPAEEWSRALEAASAPPVDLGVDPTLLSGPGALPPRARAELVRQARIRLLKQQSRQG
jgi:tRNA nucleotidyltransferase (CCA-adding enzyme)